MPGSHGLSGGQGLMGLDALDRIRQRREPKPWVRAPFAPAYPGPVLAFDQALANTGWAFLIPSYPHVIDRGVLHSTPGERQGMEDNLSRAVELEEQIDALMLPYSEAGGLLVAHEAPAVMGYRVESSLLVALAVRIVARRQGCRVVMVQAQHAKARMTGNANATKPEIKVALEEMWPHLNQQGWGPWNADVRDAVIVGINAMEQPGDSDDQQAQ